MANKNTVTIVAVLIGVLVLWYFYNYRVNNAVTTITVPYAIDRIESGGKIETDNIGYKKVTVSSTSKSDIVTSLYTIQDKYICTGTSVPKNGFIYASQVCDKQELPNSIYDNIPDGYTIFALNVNNKMTYANSIKPGDYIDLYLQAQDSNREVIYGKLIESIKVLSARDSRGKEVFYNGNNNDINYLLFAVPDEYHKLLNIALLITDSSIKIIPVPRNASYSQNAGEMQVASQSLYNYIMSRATDIAS